MHHFDLSGFTCRGVTETLSAVSLLKQGLHAIQRGCEAEGVALFVLARTKLSPDQEQLASALDSFIEGFAEYLQVQQGLHEASTRFARAYAFLQTEVTALTTVLPALIQDIEFASHEPSSVSASVSASAESDSPARVLPVGSQTMQRTEPLALEETSPGAGESAERAVLPGFSINCLGRFEVRRLDNRLVLCSNRNGQAILRYFVAQPSRGATVDMLQALFWPDDEPEAAQRKLHIAISSLRRTLNDGKVTAPDASYIICKSRVYSLNPAVPVRTDVDEFLRCYQAGRQSDSRRIAFYEQACRLYAGPFLPEDMYADWSFLQREHLCQVYLTMCRVLAEHYLHNACYEDAAYWTMAILRENRCDELAHRFLIQIYAAQGRRSEALQQYQRCQRILHEELNVQPLPETTRLYQALLIGESLPET